MRVLFLLTTVGCRVKAHHATGFLSAFLKDAGHETAYLELDRMDPNQIDDAVTSFRPHILAASTVMQQFRFVQTSINYIKHKYPEIKTILGGTHAILKPDCIEEIDGLDAICISDGEIPLLRYVESIERGTDQQDIPSIFYREKGEIIRNANTFAVSEEDMAKYPLQDRMVFPRFSDHDSSTPLGFNVRVLWGRGCPYACSYCSVPSLRKVFREPLRASKASWVRYPPVEKAIEELETLRDRWIFDKFIIDDDVFTTKKDWILKFAEQYPSHLKDKVTYEANLRVESVDKEIMYALKDTGCTLLKFGLENGNANIRRKILKRPISDERIIEVFNWAHEVGIPAHTFNIVGIPEETKQTVWQTIKLNRKIRPSRVQITIFYPYFGTPLGQAVESKGLNVKEDVSYFSGSSSVEGKDMGMTAVEIERYARWFKFLVYLTYAPLLAWVQLKGNLFGDGPIFGRLVQSFKKDGLAILTRKMFRQIFQIGGVGGKELQVETMGSDGERPHISEGFQNLLDAIPVDATAEVSQYDIEDMDKNQPHMDVLRP